MSSFGLICLSEATRRADDSKGFATSTQGLLSHLRPWAHRVPARPVCELERLAESLPSRMEAPRRSPPTF